MKTRVFCWTQPLAMAIGTVLFSALGGYAQYPTQYPTVEHPTVEPSDSVRSPFIHSVVDPEHPHYGLLEAPTGPNTEIYGTPLTLDEMLAPVSSPAIRHKLIALYWEMTAKLVEYHCREYQEQQLTKWLNQMQNMTDDATVQSNVAILQAGLRVVSSKKRICELKFIQSQYELASELKQNGVYRIEPLVSHPETSSAEKKERLPLPSDYPPVGQYPTRVAELTQVALRPLSAKAVLRAKTIPLQLNRCVAQVEAYSAAEAYFNAVRGLSPETMLAAFDQQVLAHMEYSNSIYEYARQISEYVAETVGPTVTGRRLLATLIPLPKEEPTEAPPDPNRGSPVSRRSNDSVRPPRTIASVYDAAKDPRRLTNPLRSGTDVANSIPVLAKENVSASPEIAATASAKTNIREAAPAIRPAMTASNGMSSDPSTEANVPVSYQGPPWQPTLNNTSEAEPEVGIEAEFEVPPSHEDGFENKGAVDPFAEPLPL